MTDYEQRSIDRGLLDRVDRYASRSGLSRDSALSDVLTLGLRDVEKSRSMAANDVWALMPEAEDTSDVMRIINVEGTNDENCLYDYKGERMRHGYSLVREMWVYWREKEVKVENKKHACTMIDERKDHCPFDDHWLTERVRNFSVHPTMNEALSLYTGSIIRLTRLFFDPSHGRIMWHDIMHYSPIRDLSSSGKIPIASILII